MERQLTSTEIHKAYQVTLRNIKGDLDTLKHVVDAERVSRKLSRYDLEFLAHTAEKVSDLIDVWSQRQEFGPSANNG